MRSCSWSRLRYLVFGVAALSVIAVLGSAWTTRPALALTPGEVARLYTELHGEAEVPGPGDPDGFGEANVALTQTSATSAQICVLLTVQDINSATEAHIHRGTEGVAGPVVVPLPTLSSGASAGCQEIALSLANEIANHPDQFYVNVHNADYPAGAIRGQLRFDEE